MAFFFCVALALVAACNAQNTAAPAVGLQSRSAICQSRNGYYKVDDNCDSYVECTESVARDMLCPDGLHFNPAAKWPSYPCSYPSDVSCVGRGVAQKAQPTADCPHQYGYFPFPGPTVNCGEYRMCVAGRALNMFCPPGLAFNPDSSRCDWPDLVPSCKSGDFLGFTCPAVPLDINGQPTESVVNYKYDGNCYYFFSCEQGRARLLSCDEGLAFDPASGHCNDEDLVECKAAKSKTNNKIVYTL